MPSLARRFCRGLAAVEVRARLHQRHGRRGAAEGFAAPPRPPHPPPPPPDDRRLYIPADEQLLTQDEDDVLHWLKAHERRMSVMLARLDDIARLSEDPTSLRCAARAREHFETGFLYAERSASRAPGAFGVVMPHETDGSGQVFAGHAAPAED